jgi:UDP-N-acetylglucosamine--N-acetylmuramyl-(pentapeptide) pyrophosphoryl-undecaprenol N-acetylglucosamine transferase
MRIVLAGGGTGGHFYPLIAVAEAVYKQAKDQKIVGTPEIHFFAPDPFDREMLQKHDITYRHVSSGKLSSHKNNFFSYLKAGMGILKALWSLFVVYPDVVFAKGGYASFPTLMAARILRIPVVLHESDSVPGRTNKWASSFADRVAVSYPQAVKHFPEGNVAVTGNPVRSEIAQPAMSGARKFLEIPKDIPVIFVIGGSQGSQTLNSVILSTFPELLEEYAVIHQTGPDNLTSVKQATDMMFKNLSRDKQHLEDRHKTFGYLDTEAMRMAAGAADIVISRAGSTIFEIAAWAVPSILIPLEIAHNGHQKENAYAYARNQAATVIEEPNLSDDILINEITNILDDPDTYENMVSAAADFYDPDSADIIAEELIYFGNQHT